MPVNHNFSKASKKTIDLKNIFLSLLLLFLTFFYKNLITIINIYRNSLSFVFFKDILFIFIL